MDKKIVAYIRDSLGNKECMDKQKEKIIKFAKEQYNKEEKDITFFQDGKSLLEKREDFDNMMNQINEGKFNLLLITHSNRLYRLNYENGEKILNEIFDTIKKNNMNIVSIDEQKSI